MSTHQHNTPRNRDRDYNSRHGSHGERRTDREYGRPSRGREQEDSPKSKPTESTDEVKIDPNELKKVAFGQRAAFIEQKKQELEAIEAQKQIATIDIEAVDDDELENLLGISMSFTSTKGKHVKGANAALSRTKTKREYRQYMNRKGGFHRGLDNKQ